MHTVYPFNGTKEERRSISFNAKIDEKLFNNYINKDSIPDPDLIIRTGGEYRLSNFLIWQSAYSEFYTSEVLWPDFTKIDFYDALKSYSLRNRRFGTD